MAGVAAWLVVGDAPLTQKLQEETTATRGWIMILAWTRFFAKAQTTVDTSHRLVRVTRSVTELLRDLLRPQLWRLVVGLLLILVARAASLVPPAASKYIVDDVINRHRWALLMPIMGVVCASVLVQAILSLLLATTVSTAGLRLVAQLRCMVYSHVSHFLIEYFDRNKTGEVSTRIMSDVEGLRNLLGPSMIEFAGGIITAGLSLIWLVRINIELTMFTVMSLLIFVGTSTFALKKIRVCLGQVARVQAEVTGRLVESIGGIRVVKGFGAEECEEGTFAQGVENLFEANNRSVMMMSAMGITMTAIMALLNAAVMYISATQIRAGSLTMGGLVSFTLFVTFLMSPMYQLSTVSGQLVQAMAGLDRTRELLQEPREDENEKRTVVVPTMHGHVVFRDVGFAYESGKPVLANVSFEAVPGSSTALVGHSGAGKSTIISLITAFHSPCEGAISVDGHNINNLVLANYRRQLGVVFQDTFLFAGTIGDNVRIARPSASRRELIDACKLARVDDFVSRLRHGYETEIGERGVRLSGGQRQRLALARAILANPRILVLDEATSHLDSESEAAVQEGLAYLMGSRTTFIIAHRLSTIKRCDQILVIERGRIVERGTHSTLCAARGRYYALYEQQFAEAEVRL